MGYSRNLLWLVCWFIPFFLFSGCGDLEPEMQDTRSVVLKMNFNQRSSSRSSQISQAEVSSHKTHLILALPAWENLRSNYSNYYSSFAQELMNPSDNKVSLEIPLNTQMKIFAFLFRDEYTKPQLLSGVSEVGYYGESQPFSIGTNTNNLRLNITLQSADTTAPTVRLTPANITSSGFAVVQSTETGTAYLINTDVTVSNLASIYSAADNMTNSVTISNANSNTSLSTAGLLNGNYKAYAVDTAGNLSAPSLDNVTIGGQLVDIDGNVYRTVVIGTQHWMAENLKVTKYRNGDEITHITVNSIWSSNTDGAYGYYENNTTNRDTYGMLYNWYAVDNSSSRYICPEGWHVPTNSEFSNLKTELGSNPAAKLKETGTVHWANESTGTSNSSGFTALPAGYRIYNNGTYTNLRNYTYFWTSSTSGTSGTYRFLSTNSSTSFSSNNNYKTYGFSVRCIED